MPLLMLKDLPRYECLLEAAKKFPDLDPSATEVFLQLLRTGDDLSKAENEYLGQHAISQGRFCVLMLLLEKPGCGATTARSPAELADHAGVTRATMTGLIDTLERDGFVKRVPDPNDRRMMSVNLTPKAHAFLATMLPGYFRRVSAFMSHLTESERRTFVQLLGKIQEGLMTASPEDDQSAPPVVPPTLSA